MCVFSTGFLRRRAWPRPGVRQVPLQPAGTRWRDRAGDARLEPRALHPGQRRLRPRCHLAGRERLHRSGFTEAAPPKQPEPSGLTGAATPERPRRRPRRSPGAGRGVRGGPGRAAPPGDSRALHPSAPCSAGSLSSSSGDPQRPLSLLAPLPAAPLHPRPRASFAPASLGVQPPCPPPRGWGSNCAVKKKSVHSLFLLPPPASRCTAWQAEDAPFDGGPFF